METNSIGSMLTKTQRLVLGSFVLFLVDIIWVSSSELTKVTQLICLQHTLQFFICSIYITMLLLKSRFSVLTLKHQCLRCIYLDFYFGLHGETTVLVHQIIL